MEYNLANIEMPAGIAENLIELVQCELLSDRLVLIVVRS